MLTCFVFYEHDVKKIFHQKKNKKKQTLFLLIIYRIFVEVEKNVSH